MRGRPNLKTDMPFLASHEYNYDRNSRVVIFQLYCLP